ncbi:MAG TPA: MBL fold metallo-hydrolase [Solirubrobacteraceae bacterium]|nr:MBL fold metallo-hydrolase [Solirubrobacteraceae bacterium]
MRILGAGGWMPTGTHATCSALLRQGDAAVLIDAGSGVERLVADRSLLDGVERVELVLTHFHLDHVVGLAYLPGLRMAGGMPPRIWGPAQALFGISTDDVLRTLYAPPFYDADYGLIATEVRELAEGEQAIGPFRLTTRIQPSHSTPTLALRFDELLTYCTDTPYDAGNAEFAAGSRVLMHEAWCTGGAPEATEIHSSGADAGRVARDAGVERLVLIHLNPGGGHDAVLEEARGVFEGAELGADLLELDL